MGDITKVLDETPAVEYRAGEGDISSEKIFEMLDLQLYFSVINGIYSQILTFGIRQINPTMLVWIKTEHREKKSGLRV